MLKAQPKPDLATDDGYTESHKQREDVARHRFCVTAATTALVAAVVPI